MKNHYQWIDSIRAKEKAYWEQRRRFMRLSINGPAYSQAAIDLETARKALFDEIHSYCLSGHHQMSGDELWIIRRHHYWVTPIAISCIEKVVEI